MVGEVFSPEFRALEPAPLASWEALASPAVDDEAVRRRRLPDRRDQTSAGIFTVVGILGVVLALVGFGWLLGNRSSGGAAPAAAPASTRTIPGTPAELHEQPFSGSNLEQLAAACLVYAKANGGRLPSYAAQLRPLFGSRFPAVMDVPETPEREESGYVVRMNLTSAMPGNTPILFEAGTRPDGTRGVAYMDGTVRILPRGDPELRRALAR
jgi:hypothetical protein